MSSESIEPAPIALDLQSAVPLPAGHRVGRFQITAALEQSDAVISYSATDLEQGEVARVVEFAPSTWCWRESDGSLRAPAASEESTRFLAGLRRFQNLARTLSHLDIASLARVHDCWLEQGTCYYSTAARGGRRLDLPQSHHGEAAPEGLIWHLADRTLRALEALHSVHCLHLEVGPRRIAWTAGGDALLLEPDSAWRLLDSLGAGSRAQFRGHFAAPELHGGETRGEDIGSWTDIYGLAATMYRLATGEPPPRAADRVPGDTELALVSLTRGRYSPRLLSSIVDGLSLDSGVRAAWATRWRQDLRRLSAPDRGLDDLACEAAVEAPRAAPGELDTAACADEMTVVGRRAPPAVPATRPAIAMLPGRRRMRPAHVAALILVGLIGALAARPPGSERPVQAALNPTPVSVAVLASPPAPPASRAVRQALESTRLRLASAGAQGAQIKGHVTAALDIDADGRVVTVAILWSKPSGVFDSEVIRTLLRWQYVPTGAAEHTTIDIAVNADPD
jgi:non-specific serine/threonine protein kinase